MSDETCDECGCSHGSCLCADEFENPLPCGTVVGRMTCVPAEQFDRMQRDHAAMQALRTTAVDVRKARDGRFILYCDDSDAVGIADGLAEAILDYRDAVQRRKEAT